MRWFISGFFIAVIIWYQDFNSVKCLQRAITEQPILPSQDTPKSSRSWEQSYRKFPFQNEACSISKNSSWSLIGDCLILKVLTNSFLNHLKFSLFVENTFQIYLKTLWNVQQ